MILCIANVLSPEQLGEVRRLLGEGTHVDGKQTAGWHARLVKHNTQLAATDTATKASDIVRKALMGNEVFRAAVQPRQLRAMLFSRYEPGMEYGAHVDDALMGRDGERMRSDVSMTVFLADADSYEGGELVMETTGGEQSYKLDAGAAIIYPSNTLHRVAPVTGGVREVAVSWAQSLIRAPEQREILLDLDTARRSLFQREGKSREFDLLSKSHANLLRMWAET
ncbi:Fe2+-dependent dioxygenase [Ferruginivarius sediminum]|uniref:Fe2+-dependent dioxygenase n=1 Tax=Ferruginivarius sediminum TaxID=2661937 RepID=A0A369TAP5_9PROT|nr:Fe2+-dependent dioxygenase [Ferruginivarius sediminum]RDD62401.1 Fe2+-dependent dioxygenase [Ferruginivarius sediminum]